MVSCCAPRCVLPSHLKLPVRLLALSLPVVLTGCGADHNTDSNQPPQQATIVSVSVACSPASISIDQTSTCTRDVAGTVNFTNAVTWSVSPSSMGSVSTAGVFTPAASGTAAIIATSTQDTTKSGSATVTVQAIIDSIAVTCQPDTIAVGQSSQCAVTVHGQGADNSAITWSATKGAITSSGLFTATTPGLASITATSSQDSTKAGSTDVTVSSPLAVATPIAVPSVLVAGQSMQVTITALLRGAAGDAQVQLFNLSGGAPVFITSMTDDGQNGDALAGDFIYTSVATLNAPAAASLPMRIVVTCGTAVVSGDFSVPVIEIPSYSANSDLNQAQTRIFSSAIQTRDFLTTSGWTDPTAFTLVSNNLIEIFRQFVGLANQTPELQPASSGAHQSAAPNRATEAARLNSIVSGVLDFFSHGIFSPLINSYSCNQLMDSLAGAPKPPAKPVYSTYDPRMIQFADALATACTTAPDCGGYTESDFLTDTSVSYDAYLWAHEYLGAHKALPVSISGCSGGVSHELADVAVKNEVGQFSSIAGDGISDILGGGRIVQTAVDVGVDTMVGWTIDSSSKPTFIIGQTAPDETFAAPAGTYNLAYSFGGDSDRAIVANTPVYPRSTTIISLLSPSAHLTVTPPYISGIAPTSGPPGQTVSISGTGFDPNADGNQVYFNGTQASITASSGSGLQATAPAGAGTGPITVSTANGATTSENSFTVTGATLNPLPSIASLLPAWVAAGSSPRSLLIGGSGFQPASTVTFNGIDHPAESINATQLVIALTSDDLASAGSFPVVVTNPAPGGGASSPASFSVVGIQRPGIWTWMGGSQSASADIQYAPSSAPTARYGAAGWTDSAGNFWLAGGGSRNGGGINDLWKLIPSTAQWTQVRDDSGQPSGNYGVMGVPNPANTPPPRPSAVTWIDSNNLLWLFGGFAYSDYDSNSYYYGDLWNYNPVTNEWTWVKGHNYLAPGWGVTGTIGAPDDGNLPTSRTQASGWIGSDGNLWLFGGFGMNGYYDYYPFGDLWKYSPVTNQWTWIGGTSQVYAKGQAVYGSQGVPAAANIPGARRGAVSLNAANGNFWLFGGNGQDTTYPGGYLSDLWQFNPRTGLWTWIGGPNAANQPGNYGQQGVPATQNLPPPRTTAAGWVGKDGNLWFFGGGSSVAGGSYGDLSDLWTYNSTAGIWIWVTGPQPPNQPGAYGTQGVPSAENTPGAREETTCWTDKNGNLWLFGGYGYDANGNLGYLNDLWRYQP